MLGQPRNGLQIGTLRVGGKTSQDHVLGHLLAELRHGETSSAAHRHGLLGARKDARGGQDGGARERTPGRAQRAGARGRLGTRRLAQFPCRVSGLVQVGVRSNRRRRGNQAPRWGTHFLHNVIALGIGYFAVRHDTGEGRIDWKWLAGQVPYHESGHLRHLRMQAPLDIRIDGRSGLGAALKPS